MKRYQKVLLWGAAAVVLAVIAIQVYISFFLEDQLRNRITHQVRQSSDGEYRLELEDLDIGLLSRSVTLTGISVQSENERIHGETQELNLSGISLLRFWRQNALSIQEIDVQNPSITLISERSGGSSGRSPAELSGRLASGILQELNELRVGEILISGVSVNIAEAPDTGPYFSFNETDLILYDFKVDSSALNSESILPVNNIETTLRNMEYHTTDGLYTLKFQQLEFSGHTGSANITGTEMLPRLEREAFFNKVGYATDQIDLEIPFIRFRGIDFNAINRQEKYEAELVQMNRADIRIFRDKRYPEREDKEIQPVPQELILNLNFSLRIDTLEVLESFVRYSEHEEGADEPGEVDFSSLNATLTNMTNVGEQIELNNEMILEAKANVMDQAELNAKFVFPLMEHRHFIEGTVESMDATHFNRALEPLAFQRIESGRVLSIQFLMELGEEEASGDVEFLYEDLNITLLSEGSNDENLITKAGTFLANTFAIESNNNDPEDPRIGEVSFERDKEKFVFNYWWKSLQSGLESSIGL
ncbi:MAG: hypothetical protein WD604_06105 [Balneolaceae bacterium]